MKSMLSQPLPLRTRRFRSTLGCLLQASSKEQFCRRYWYILEKRTSISVHVQNLLGIDWTLESSLEKDNFYSMTAAIEISFK